MEMIHVDKLHKNFGALEVLKGVSLSVAEGEIVSIIGPSGSGKSTLLRCINHLEIAYSGSIAIEGRYLCKQDSDHSKTVYASNKEVFDICSKLGMVFQNFHLFPHRSVMQNIILAPIKVKKMSKSQAEEIAIGLLKKVGLLDKKDAYPCELSGGQKQRVAIARALAMQPEIMLFDEPTSALDPELIGEVLQVIKDLAKEQMTMIIVTHEMNFAREISDRIIFMENGEIIVDGLPDDIFVNPDHPRMQAFIKSIL